MHKHVCVSQQNNSGVSATGWSWSHVPASAPAACKFKWNSDSYKNAVNFGMTASIFMLSVHLTFLSKIDNNLILVMKGCRV